MSVLHFPCPSRRPSPTLAPRLRRRPRSSSDLDTEYPVSHLHHGRWLGEVYGGPNRRRLEDGEHHPVGAARPTAYPGSCEEVSCGKKAAEKEAEDMDLGAYDLVPPLRRPTCP